MTGHRTRENFSSEPTRCYKTGNSDQFIWETKLEREPESNWLKPNPDNQTHFQPSKLKSRPILLVSETTKPVESAKPQQSKVSGAVLQADEMSVKCELYLNASHVEVQLPRILFPEKISYGLPISLKMVEDDGIRQPRITVRKADTEKFKELKAEIAAILEEF